MKPAAIILALLLAGTATAQSSLPPARYANTQIADPAKEAEARKLMEELRCLVCQGQSIVDSDADMAGDMRSLVRSRIAAGESAGSVRQWLIRSYGDYVTYDPPLSAATAPLWIAPLLLLAIGGLIMSRSFKRKKR
jgi:cytochrome c-type biogenesis protein CcmH